MISISSNDKCYSFQEILNALKDRIPLTLKKNFNFNKEDIYNVLNKILKTLKHLNNTPDNFKLNDINKYISTILSLILHLFASIREIRFFFLITIFF